MQISMNKAHVVIALWGKEKLYPFNFTYQLHMCRVDVKFQSSKMTNHRPCEALSKTPVLLHCYSLVFFRLNDRKYIDIYILCRF